MKGHFELATRANVLVSQMILIHFHLASLASSLHFDIIRSSLIGYFPHGGLRIFEVPFDFGTSRGWKRYDALVNDLLATHGGGGVHTTVVITNHTDDARGDPFIGRDSTTGEHAAATVEEVSFYCFKAY